MRIRREKYILAIQNFLDSSKKSILVLDGPRFAGKSTLLNHVYTSTEMWSGKKYYYSFDDEIGSKQFRDADDFMQYMQIKYWVDFHTEWLLLLNEIQYSKNIGSILHDLIKKKKITIRIIATSISKWEYKKFLQLREEDYELLTVHTLSFLEFLGYKGFHTNYLDPYKFSPILAHEIQPFLQEFINRWAYPSVVLAPTEEKKKQALQHIIQEIFKKDVTHWFDRNDVWHFETIMHIVNDQHAQIYNKLRIKNTYNIPLWSVERYMQFLEDNYIITTVKHFSSDKKREVSHKQKAMLLDLGIKNYLHNAFWRRVHDQRTMMYVTIQEIYKNLDTTSTIMTYKKINWSAIDFIIQKWDLLYPIVIWERNTATLPKVYNGFMKQYGEQVATLYKTSLSTSAEDMFQEKSFYTIPYYLIGMVL